MAVIIKPNITVDDIVLEMDENSPDAAENIMSDWGTNVPMIKIGDFVLNMGDLRNFSLKVALNSLPTFSMTVNDEAYFIRAELKKDIDKCVIFIGYKDWYIKFNGLIDKTTSNLGGVNIRLNGICYNDKIFDGVQKSYKDMTITDILSDVCKQTSMGLFTIDNAQLSQKLDYSILVGTRYLDYFDSIISGYTTNLYAIDCNYYFHVADIETLRKQNYDKYSLDWSTGKKIDEHDIIFKSINFTEQSKDEKDYKIPIDLIALGTNFSEIHRETYKSYAIGYGGNGEADLKSIDTIGIGSNKTNTFFGFKNHKFPYYKDRINKLLGGNIISIKTNNVIFELTPFSVVGFEMYLPQIVGRDPKLDEEHSGKKIVIGYAIDYQKSKELNTLTQTIDLI